MKLLQMADPVRYARMTSAELRETFLLEGMFTSAASGSPTPTIQWMISTNGGVTFSNVTNGGVYSGATTGTLIVASTDPSLNGDEFEAAR